jgi:hypothetical protein
MKEDKLGILKECKDYEILIKYFDEEMLLEFEKQLEEYYNSSDKTTSDFAPIICWCTGLWDTNDLINHYC